MCCVDGTEEEGSLEAFLETKADKHTSRSKRPSGLNEDTADSNTESDDRTAATAVPTAAPTAAAKVAAIAPTALTTATDASIDGS